MRKLKLAYERRVEQGPPGDLLWQVGHTEGGTSISETQFDAMISDLEALLDLQPQDRLLDMCCGNGLVTARLSGHVAECVGLELSGKLVKTARRLSSAENIRYEQMDLKELGNYPPFAEEPFTKVMMHAALQHFRPRDLEPLLRAILARCGPAPVIVFGFVPESGKQRLVFNTLRKRFYRAYLKMTGKDIFGTWWARRELEAAAQAVGLNCTFHPVHSELAASSHRFNVRMSRLFSDDCRQTDTFPV